MRILIVSLIAVALWSIDSLGAIQDGAVQGAIEIKIAPSFAKVNLSESQPTCPGVPTVERD